MKSVGHYFSIGESFLNQTAVVPRSVNTHFFDLTENRFAPTLLLLLNSGMGPAVHEPH